ncbi:PAS domain S-box protein, partial [Candidatus Berkelbacteria bacterium]|nr:PAS domain S-box protein [Candidatus Berkelbacteria bacterium]
MGISLGTYIQKLFLDQTKFQYAKALDLSLNSIYSVDINGIVTRWYPGAKKTYGWSAEEMMGKSIKKIYPNHKSQEFDEISKRIVTGRSLDHFESQRIDKNGKCILVNSSYDGILDLFGKVSEIIVVEQDMTLQNDLALHLTESNARFNSFIEITEDWIWEFDKNGTFL